MSADVLTHLLNFPEVIEKLVFPNTRSHETTTHGTSRATAGGGSSSNIAVDILDSPKELVFFVDVPGLSKSDIQVTLEDENTLVIKSNGKKRKRGGEEEEEGCKYLRLERRPTQNVMRKFQLPYNCNASAITAKCEHGVLSVVVEKLPPPPKSKTVQVSIS